MLQVRADVCHTDWSRKHCLSRKPEEIILRYVAVLQYSIEKPDVYLLQGNGDECAVAFESYMTTFLPHGHEAEVVAKNLDKILSVDWSQTRQRADQGVSGVAQPSLSAWLPFL